MPDNKIILTPSWGLLVPSFNLLKERIIEIAYLAFLPSFLGSVGLEILPMISTHMDGGRVIVSLSLVLIAALWTIINLPALTFLLLASTKGDKPTVMECYKGAYKYFWRIILLQIVVGIVIFVGLLALIVPGIIFIRRYYLAAYFLMDKDLGVFDAMKKSSAQTKPVAGYIWGLIGVSVVLSLASSFLAFIPFFGRLIPTAFVLIYAFAPALRYLEVIKSSTHLASAKAPKPPTAS